MIDKINSPEDLKKLSLKELPQYCSDARDFIIDTVNRNGGHLSSNLGTVEMTVALHYVFSSPNDKIVWDVGHQAYTHKLITGRGKLLENLRKSDGASGFPNVNESVHDTFTVGHSSTSLSSALGLARARDLMGEKYSVIAVIGDGALTGGMAYEALNDIGSSKTPLLIILNDNEMSISKNVGGTAKYLSRLRLSRGYTSFKLALKRSVSSLPFFGDKLFALLDRVKNTLKNIFVKGKMFEQMGIRYYGPIDGHDLKTLIRSFENVRNEKRPVIIHIRTKKGKGLHEAEMQPEKFHGVTAPCCENAESMSGAVGETLASLADTDDKITAITAAMSDGTGLKPFYEKHPQRFFDVGIAEQHALTMCAGMAKSGFKPYFAVYSSFLQRGFDQIIHDIALMNLPVKILIDRAGIIGADGVTHQGVFDIAYLNLIPNMTILSPADTTELVQMLRFSKDFQSPLAIRYPKSGEMLLYGTSENRTDTQMLKWETVRCIETDNIKKKICILATGARMLKLALKTKGAEIVNARCIKPLDTEFLNRINGEFDLIITMEEGAVSGGFGEAVLDYLNKTNLKSRIVTLGIPDAFITNTDTNIILNEIYLNLQNEIKNCLI